MPYESATHGFWCNSRTFPIRCQYCDEQVFYFSCDHGCKVFFNNLGPPWPEHRCLSYLIHLYGKSFVEQGLATMMMTPGVRVGQQIDQAYAEQAQQPQQRYVAETISCIPVANKVTIDEGFVREIIPEVNMYARFKVPFGSPIGAALLGTLAKDNYAQLTIHTQPLATEDNYSYTFFISRRLAQQFRIRKGDYVKVQLRGLAMPKLKTVWMCEAVVDLFEK